MSFTFRTIVGRFQNGSEQRQIANAGALLHVEIPYAKLSQADKNTVKTAVTAAKGSSDTTLSIYLPYGTGLATYTNMTLDSDVFESAESAPRQYAAPLKLTQTVTQALFPGSPGGAFPTLANGTMGILPYTQRKTFQTVGSVIPSGVKYATPEFGGGLAGYPGDGLMGWTLDERMLSDADVATRFGHFLANWGRAFSYPFTDEDAVTYSHANANGSPHYASDVMTIRYNGVNNSGVKTDIELTFD